MRDLIGDGKFSPVSDEDIKNAEKELGFKLPDDVVYFYKNINVYSSPYSTFEIDGWAVYLEYYHPLKKEVLYDIELESAVEASLAIIRDEDYPLKDVFMFNTSPFGDLFYVSASPETYGKVFYFSLELFEEDDDNPSFLANSLGEFIDGLTTDEEKMKAHRDWVAYIEANPDFSWKLPHQNQPKT